MRVLAGLQLGILLLLLLSVAVVHATAHVTQADDLLSGVHRLIKSGRVVRFQDSYVGLLRDIRSSAFAAVPPYSANDLQRVAHEVDKLFDIWVNRESKIQNYGIDIIPRKDNITKNWKSYVNDPLSFHISLAKLFISARDFHTNYYIPAPYGCIRSFLPWSFDFLESSDYWNPTVVVVSRTGYARLVDMSPLYGPSLNASVAEIEPGDELVSINGKSFDSVYFESYQSKTEAANEMGGLRYFSYLLSMRPSVLYPLPTEEEDTQTFVFRKQSGKSVSVKVPYLSLVNGTCLQPLVQGETVPNVTEARADARHSKQRRRSTSGTFSYEKEFRQFFPDHATRRFSLLSSFKLNSTPESLLSWGIYRPNFTNLGIISLKSFTPSTSVQNTVSLIRGLLVRELAGTNAIVFDIRGNGGGDMALADLIPQLFKPNFQASSGRLLISKTNTAILHTTNASLALSDWIPGYFDGLSRNQTYGDVTPFFSGTTFNTIGTAYLKPVALFIDAYCYSACDLFSANMQDSGTALIFGQDLQTGGGGCNVVAYSSFLIPLFGTSSDSSNSSQVVFSPLPYSSYNQNNSHLGAADLRVAWRQVIRTGTHAGALIEDSGVAADYYLRPSWADFFSNQSTLSQLEYLGQLLADLGSRTGQNSLAFLFEPLRFDIPVRTLLVLNNITSSGIRTFYVSLDGSVVGSTSLASTDLAQFNIETGYTTDSVLRYLSLTILGLDIRDKAVLQTNRQVRLIPHQGLSSVPFAFDFTQLPTFCGIYTQSPETAGWVLANGTLAIATDPQTGLYANNVDTSFSIFLNLPSGHYNFSVDARVDTEASFDLFLIQTRSRSTQRTSTLLELDGRPHGARMWPYSFQISSDAAEIVLRFTSDESVAATGVRISRISLRALGHQQTDSGPPGLPSIQKVTGQSLSGIRGL
ncbi:uncharacterized protein BJ171DRAFT_598274 [Polychytrium aggregatum]|uniref:uncharacterized protein n=1 Tax=Polychytrium aggregatum TaxID=110093 RepID=UPI0022FE3E00|nr:uncharacterized protein BJ171DRAFT_598274 [Polychytrium aggregatum]KAI9205605.1 hypothetical protein BJ171DRAFT_598274 [Polychytrium aggregatum]